MARTLASSGRKAAVNKVDVKRMIKSAVKTAVEVKYDSVTFTAGTVIAGAVSSISSPMVQGTGGSDLVGRHIHALKLRMHFNALATASSDTVRVIIFSDNFGFGVSPVVTDVLESATYVSGYALNQLDQKRFRIHHDAIFTVSPLGSNFENNALRDLSINRDIHYLNNSGTTTNQGKGQLYLLVIARTANTSWGVNFQLHYTDA